MAQAKSGHIPRVVASVSEGCFDAFEGPAVANLQAGDLGPAIACPGAQALFQGRFGRVWVPGHDSHLARRFWRSPACRAWIRWAVRHKDQMPVSGPYVIVLSSEEEAVLAARARSARSEYHDRLRAQDRARCGRRPEQRRDRRGGGGVHRHGPQVAPPVRRRRAAGAEGCPAQRAPAGVHRRGPGRGRRAGVRAVGRVRRAMSKWNCPELAPDSPPVARSRPRRPRSAGGWPMTPSSPGSTGPGFPSVTPEFAVKAARVLDLYAGTWDGGPLGSNDYVICAMRKPRSRPAAAATHPAPGQGPRDARRARLQAPRRLAYLAAWDVHRGQVTGRASTRPGSAVLPAGGTGDDHRTVGQRGACVLDHR